MLSCYPKFAPLSPTILFFSSFHGLVVWGSGLQIDRVFSLSPDLALLTLFNNNNAFFFFLLNFVSKIFYFTAYSYLYIKPVINYNWALIY